MQPTQLEQLKRLISGSPLLQNGERAHWLELLSLMNDKQLLELEAILRPMPVNAAPAPAKSVPVAMPLPNQQIARGIGRPTLSHLENLPTIVTDMGPRPQTETPPPRVAPPVRMPESRPPIALRPKQPVDITEKELPSGHLADSEHLLNGQPVKPSPQPAPQMARPASPPGVQRSAPPIFKPIPPGPPIPQPPPPIEHPLRKKASVFPLGEQNGPVASPTKTSTEPLQINSLADLSRMGIETFHAVGATALTTKLLSLVKQVGYFDIIFALEQSPLYADYVATGQNLLEENATFNGRTEVRTRHGVTLLSRPDFEAMADLLRQIQIN